MTPRRAKPPDSEADLRQELVRAYLDMGHVTSRLMLVNEAVDAALGSHERAEICERFLAVVAGGVEITRAALFLVEPDGYSVGAAHGLSDDEHAALVASQQDIDACAAALDARKVHVLDLDLTTEDALEAVERGLYGEPGPEELAEEEEAEAEETEEAGEAEEEDAEAEADSEASDEGEQVEGAFFGLYMPVRLDDEPVAVLGLGERAAAKPYTGDDLVFLSHLLRQLAVSLLRATLLERNAERLRETEALLKVSREITSTLDLEAVLRAVVNTAGAVVEIDRAEIALLKGGRLALRTVSGLTRLDPDQAETFKIERPLEFLRLEGKRVQLGAADLDDSGTTPGAAVFGEYFESQEMRSFIGLPLKDDQGLLGYLCLESHADAWDLAPEEGDALDILAAQTTMAVRNALLYSQIPLKTVTAPMAQMKRALGSWTPAFRRRALWVAAAAVLLLVLPLMPERAGGPAEVRPLRFQGVRSPIDGVVARVFTRGGGSVRAGEHLAEIEDLDLSGRIASLVAEVEAVRREAAASRQASDFAGWRTAQLRLTALERTLEYEQRRAEGGRLTAPFDGQILDVDLDRRVGQHIEQGESFCTVARLDSVGADLEVPEERIGRVRIGQPVSVKVMGYPTIAFRGRVTEIGWEGRPDAKGVAQFLVRAEIANPLGLLRPGMSGAGRATIGRRPLLVAIFEPLARSIQMALW